MPIRKKRPKGRIVKKVVKKKRSAAGNGQPKQDPDSTRVPLEYTFSENIVPVYSNGFVVRYDAGMFHLFFFNSRGPIILETDSPKKRQEQIAKVDVVKSNCVAHLVVTLDQARKVISALTRNYEKFVQTLPDDVRVALESGGDE
jgi:hypothetical protein